MGAVAPVFGAQGQRTWRTILRAHERLRDRMIAPMFGEGLKVLGITPDRIPELDAVNAILEKRTGYRGVYVEGLEAGGAFFKLLAERRFPIGGFIRAPEDLSYTPAPDVVHDLFGHLPFFADPRYADFCADFGCAACHYADQPELLRQFERFFWFTIEFGLVRTPAGLRVFGAGIASSIGECEYALSGKPELVPFDVELIRRQEFRIDQMQTKLFVLENVEQLYGSLTELCAKIAGDNS